MDVAELWVWLEGPLTKWSARLAGSTSALRPRTPPRRTGHRTSTVGEDFTAEQSQLLAVPAEQFDAARLLPARRVDNKAASACASTTTRSRPLRRPAGGLAAGCDLLDIHAGGQTIAWHERSVIKSA